MNVIIIEDEKPSERTFRRIRCTGIILPIFKTAS